MYCDKCGKEISDQAKFCRHCGAQVNQPSRPQSAPQSAQTSRPQSAPQSAQTSRLQSATQSAQTSRPQGTTQSAQSAPASKPQPQKKGGAGKMIIALIIAAIVYFVVKMGIENIFSNDDSDAGYTSGNSGSIVIYGHDISEKCSYGGVYENGYLTYGAARVRLPGYSLESYGATDYLIAPSMDVLIGVNRSVEINVSYSESGESGILDSYKTDPTYSNVKMVKFEKYKVGGYGVVEYVVSADLDGVPELIGELIIFPSETPKYTVRISVEALASAGTGAVDRVFDTLAISTDYESVYDGETGYGVTSITVR